MRDVQTGPPPNAFPIGLARAAYLASLALCSLGAAHAREILLLQPSNADAHDYSAIVDGLRDELAVASPDDTRIYSEVVDSDFTGPRDRAVFADYLHAKYGEAGVDAVIALSDEAVRFVAEHRAALSDVPLVYVARPAPAAGSITESSVVAVPFVPARTVELALRLQPELDNVFVVDGGALGGPDAAAMRSALDAYSGRLNVEYLEGLPPDDLVERVARLPPRSAVLYASLGEDGAPGRELAQRLSDGANAPVYGVHDRYLGLGVVGGFMARSEQIGAELARQTLRRLGGEYSELAEAPGASFIVDARALQRWSLDEARLPMDTEIEFAPASIWTRYQSWIITLLVLVAVQFALIVTLLAQSVSRRRDRLASTETAHRFRLARMAGKVGIWQWDLEKDELIVDAELRELLGFPAGAGFSNSDGAALVHEEDMPKLRDAVHAHAQGLTPSVELQYRMTDRDGNVRWLLARGQTVATPNRLIGTAIDITDRKRDEDEKAHTLAELQQQRNELAHLGRAAMAGALSGAVAHELNQPLSAMMSNARAALQFMARGIVDAQEIKDILADIESDGRRAGEVIRHLRSLLRRGEGQLETVTLDDTIELVLRLIHSDIVNLNVKVLHERAAGVPPVSADSVQLQQVLLNLLANACDALKSVDPRDRRISIAVAERVPGRVRLSVTDNGCGLGPSSPEQVFKPFFTTKRSGLGLGLSISRSIIDAHGGRIWAENNGDAGATFHVELPVAAAAERVA